MLYVQFKYTLKVLCFFFQKSLEWNFYVAVNTLPYDSILVSLYDQCHGVGL